MINHADSDSESILSSHVMETDLADTGYEASASPMNDHLSSDI